MKDKEEGQAESGARTMKDDAFGEYRSVHHIMTLAPVCFSVSPCPDALVMGLVLCVI